MNRKEAKGENMGKMTRRAFAVVAAAALVSAMGLAGCSGGQGGAAGGGGAAGSGQEPVELQVFAANSLSKAMEEIQALYTQQNPSVTFADTQYKGSGELNEMLGGGAYADVLISASKGSMDAAVEKGYVDESSRVNMFMNDLVIVAREDSAIESVTLQDIADGKYTVAVGDESVPAGNYACQALSTVGAYVDPSGATGAEISGKGGSFAGITPVLQTSVGNVCKQAESGDVDVAIVYSSDVFRFGGVKVVGEIPADTHKAIVYPGAVTAQSENVEVVVAFLEWCLSDPDAQKIWNEWGFELAE